MRHRLTGLGLAVVLACPAGAQQFQFQMMSSGRNGPGVPLWNSPYKDLLVAFHRGAERSAIGAQLGLTEAALARAIDTLLVEGVLVQRGGVLRPTCMVITPEEGAALATLAVALAREAVPLMRRAADQVRAQYPEIAGLRHLAFEDVSFFVMSDVLLDNWQISALEQRWLGAERPLRGKARYYCALLARTEAHEAFGIYGNQMSGIGDGRYLGVYGNQRGSRNDLSRLASRKLADLAGVTDTTDRAALLRKLTDELRQWAQGGEQYLPAPRLTAGLTELGMIRGGRPLFAVFDSTDDRRLRGLASQVTDSLVGLLERATSRLRDAWAASRWSEETTFEQFRIQWYHFFYTALTDQLAAAGVLRVPETGLFHYLMIY